jgi:hypothetical protein
LCFVVVVLFVIKTKLAEICRMEDHITLILHHGGDLVRNENRRLQYVGGEFCVWEKMYVDELCLWDIEKMVKRCRSYFKVSKLGYMKPYEGVANDLNICLTPLTTDQHLLDMVQAARSNGNEVEIYAQHVVDSDEVEIVPLTTEEREELERAMEESLRNGKTPEEEPFKVMEVDILTAEERNVVDCLVANVQNRVGNEEENVDDMQEKNADATEGREEGNVGATQGMEEDNMVGNEGGNVTQAQESEAEESQPQETVTQQETQVEENVTKGTQKKVGTKGAKNKGKEKQTAAPKRKRPVRYSRGTGVTINDDGPLVFDSSSDDSDFEADFEVGNASQVNIEMSEPNEVCSDNDSYVSEELRTPISTDDEGDGNRNIVYPQFNENAGFGEVNLELGMEFPTLQKFKDAVKDYTIHKGKDIKWLKNDKDRARAECKHETCNWVIFCGRNKKSKCFQIKTFVSKHDCPTDFKNKQANRKWVVKMLEKVLRYNPEIKHGQIYDLFKTDYKVILDDNMIFRATKEARDLVEGSEREQYGLLWDYANELMRSNPNSTVMMNTTPMPQSPPQFKRFYVCLDACKQGFKAGCRPLIGLDGCFLKGYYGGQLLSAVGQDGNNHIYVIAYAIVDVENKDNWKWFLELLHKDLGNYERNGWNFISDMQKV